MEKLKPGACKLLLTLEPQQAHCVCTHRVARCLRQLPSAAVERRPPAPLNSRVAPLSGHGPSKAWQLGACLLWHQAFQKGLVHQQTGTQLPAIKSKSVAAGCLSAQTPGLSEASAALEASERPGALADRHPAPRDQKQKRDVNGPACMLEPIYQVRLVQRPILSEGYAYMVQRLKLMNPNPVIPGATC
ncbi:hypothetical protein QTO34_014475 [Cnephaeus nilssonii]|uniref:Uncharacterized protein n=1 Tax=Cnephaeus nilssonii TaxID=3371016 RepID=A0AA40LUB6_CNENI|nr:hypothetical protein QTO34_014475 [Eptesicus nilssonii]